MNLTCSIRLGNKQHMQWLEKTHSTIVAGEKVRFFSAPIFFFNVGF